MRSVSWNVQSSLCSTLPRPKINTEDRREKDIMKKEKKEELLK